MLWILAVLLIIPAALLGWLRRTGWSRAEAIRIVGLSCVCFFVSGPFITEHALGTGEAANYALAVGDTVVQARAGTFPAYVGQSEFAFNGRIHPLRTAVYFTHVPALLDWLTFRQLNFWGLQNLSLALSLWAAVFIAYACLRRTNALPPLIAAALASLYGLSPGLLAPAYGMDLYMTVTAAPFVVIAVHGTVQSFKARTLRNYAWMAVGLAGTWLAHPPVAAWTSLACGGIVAISWLIQWPTISAGSSLAIAGLLGFGLSGWAFASALSLREGIVEAGPSDLVSALVTSTTETVGWAGLLPVQGGGTQLGDYQLGYAGWALLMATGWAALRSGLSVVRAVLAMIALLLVLTLPVPVLHERLWHALPPIFGMLTNSWPMQRAYLIIAALAVFGFALSWRTLATRLLPGSQARRVAMAATAVLGAWTVFQAWQFVGRGYSTHRTWTETVRMHQPSNVDLTGIAYAFMPIPRQFYHGTRDPEMELRALAGDVRRILVSNADAGRIEASGIEGVLRPSGQTDGLRRFEPKLVLQPGRRYRLSLHFNQEPFRGVLILSGSGTLRREYQLPDSGSPLGFGMNPGNLNTLTLWTDASEPETVEIAVMPADPAHALPEDFARFRLEEIDRSRLPFRIVSLIPTLRIEADIPESGWLETPRIYIPGYQATVNGAPVLPRRSPDGLTLIPMPAGRHEVELVYQPAPLLRTASLVTLAAWLGLIAVGLVAGVDRLRSPTARPAWSLAPALRVTLLLAFAGLTVGAAWEAYRRWIIIRQPSAGPLVLRLALPVDAMGKAEPLVSAGSGPGSATVFVRYLSESTVAFGIDVWANGARETGPIPIDYAAEHEIKISTGFFYDAAAEELSEDLGVEQTGWLQSRTQIWLNGEEKLFTREAPRETGPKPFGLLRTVTGDGAYQHRFSGVVLERAWHSRAPDQVPLPTADQLTRDTGPLRVEIMLPTAQIGQAEPLLAIGDTETGTSAFVHYLDANHIRFGIGGPGPTIALTDPIAIDYQQPLSVAFSHPAFFENRGTSLPDYSPAQRQALLSRFRIAVNDVWMLSGPVDDPGIARSKPIRFGINSVGATYPLAEFSGRFLSSDRQPPENWPIQPGNPESATAAGTAGPIEISVRLPQQMIGRQQPIFTVGKPGEGVLIIVHYLDQNHIRVGVDVWNKALFWSQPIPVDYTTEHRIEIAMTSLFPADHPEVLALDPPVRERLRNTLTVKVDGLTAVEEQISAYDSPHEQMTPGRSDIGGSNNEPLFLGDILGVKRLPVSSP